MNEAQPGQPRILRAREAPGQVCVRPWRQITLMIVLVVMACGLASRLVFWQVIDRAQLVSVAASEHSDVSALPPARGLILDSSGNPLAANDKVYLVYAMPRLILHPHFEATALAPLLGTSVAQLAKQLSTNTTYLPLVNGVSQSTADRITALNLGGIGLQVEQRRVYPEGSLAAHVIGYVNAQGGQSGLEGYYDPLLAGTESLSSVAGGSGAPGNQVSAAGSAIASGATLHVSLDGYVQSVVEDELHKAVRQHQADGGTIIVMDPRTGFIRAMASTPSFDPNHYARSPMADYVNPAISDTYEPGSTFKIITMAAGLATHVITPNTAFDDTGAFQVANVTIHNWNLEGFGEETMTQVLQHSANVGASYVASLLGTRRFYHYVHAFGFGQQTGVDLSDEAPGVVYYPGNRNWSIVNFYTSSYGQGIAVTPLQLIDAVSAVANGGLLMKPQLVTRIDYQGRVMLRHPVVVRRVISPATARTLTHMLITSAVDGEARLALVHGYNIAAKTGTANVAGPDGSYLQGDYIASTIAYAPALAPRFAVLVIIRHPRDVIWGSTVAAPIVHDLCQELFLHYRIPPTPHPLQ